MNGTLRTAAVLLFALVATAAVTADETVLTVGRLLADVPGSSGAYVRTLDSPALVQTLSDPMTVELDGGRKIAFDANTSARLERLPSGVVRVQVLSGIVSMKDAAGEIRTAGARSVFHVDDEPVVDVPAPARPETDDRPARRSSRLARTMHEGP